MTSSRAVTAARARSTSRSSERGRGPGRIEGRAHRGAPFLLRFSRRSDQLSIELGTEHMGRPNGGKPVVASRAVDALRHCHASRVFYRALPGQARSRETTGPGSGMPAGLAFAPSTHLLTPVNAGPAGAA